MNATHTNTFEESQQQLAAGVLKQAAQDLQRFHGAATTIERELYFDAYRWVMSNDCCSPFSFLSVCQALELVPQTVRIESDSQKPRQRVFSQVNAGIAQLVEQLIRNFFSWRVLCKF
jgi:hypothetical protein